MTETQRKILSDIVDDILSMSLEELRERAKSHVNNPFEIFQEMSDAIEFSDEYKQFIYRETLGNQNDETL